MTPEDRRRLYGGRPAVSPTTPIDASGAGFVNPRPLRQDNRSNDGFWSINQYQRPQPSATPTATATPTPAPTAPPVSFDLGPAVPWVPPDQLTLRQTFGYPGGNRLQWSDIDQALGDRVENRADVPGNAPHVAMDYFGPTTNRPHTAMDYADVTPNRPHTALDYVAPQANSPHTAMDYTDVVPNRPHTAMTYIDPQTVASAGGRSPLFDTGNDWQGSDQSGSLAPPWWKETGNAGGSPVVANTPAPEAAAPVVAEAPATYVPSGPEDPAIPVTDYDETPIIADRGTTPSPIDNPSNDWLGAVDPAAPIDEARRRELILADARNTGRFSNSNNLALGALLNNNFGGMPFTRETALSPVDPGRVLVGGVEQSPGGTTDVPQYGPEVTDQELADMDAARHRNMQSTPPDTRGNMLSNPGPIAGDATPPAGMRIIGHDTQNGQPIYEDANGNRFVNPGTGRPIDPTNGLATNRQFDRATFGGVTPTVFRDPRGSAVGNLPENARNFNLMLMAAQAFGGTPNLNQPDEVSRHYGQRGHLDEEGQYVSDGGMGGGAYNPEAFRAFVYGSQNRTARTNPNTGRSFGGGQATGGVGTGGG